MQILTEKPLCFEIEEEIFLLDDRIDVSFFYPKYLEVEKKLNKLKNVVFMKEISKSIRSSAFYSSIALKYSKSGIPFVRVLDIKEGTISTENLVFIDEEVLKKNKSIRTISSGSLVISKGGTIGNVGITPPDFEIYALSRDVVGIELKDTVIPEYVSLFLSSRYGFLQLERLKQGQVQSHLTIEGIKRIRIPLHPIKTQKKIVEIMVNARKKRRKNLKEIEELKKELDTFFLKELDLFYPEKKEENIFIANLNDRLDPYYYHPKFISIVESLNKGKFKLKTLKDVVEFSNNQIDPKKEPNRVFKYIQIQNVNKKNHKISSYTPILGKEAPGRAKMLIRKGDILLPVLGGSLKSIAIAPEEYDGEVATNGFAVLRVKDENLRYFLFYYLTTDFAQLQIERELTGAIMPSISKTDVGNIVIPIPDKTTLKRIAMKIKDIDKKITKLQIEADEVIKIAKKKAEAMIIGEGHDRDI